MAEPEWLPIFGITSLPFFGMPRYIMIYRGKRRYAKIGGLINQQVAVRNKYNCTGYPMKLQNIHM